MVRVIETGIIRDNKQCIDFAGLSTDSKPTANLLTGSTFLEVNTGDVYLFDEDNNTWHKVGG